VALPTTARDIMLLGLSQSNGLGFGTNGLPYPGGFNPAGNVLIWNRSTQVFEAYQIGVNSAGVANGQFWAAEAAFSIEWQKIYPTPLYWVKRAISGTGIAPRTTVPLTGTDTAHGNSWSAYDSGKEWANFVSDIGVALQSLIAQGIQPVVRGLLVLGQETDTLLAADANAVKPELTEAILALKAAINAPLMKTIIAVVRTGTPNGPYTSTVQAAQEGVGFLPNCASVSEDDLAITVGVPGDPGHLTTTSQVTLGQRMFQAYQRIDAATNAVAPAVPAQPPIDSVPTQPPVDSRMVDSDGTPVGNWAEYFRALDHFFRSLVRT
jgi:hypothetical protein